MLALFRTAIRPLTKSIVDFTKLALALFTAALVSIADILFYEKQVFIKSAIECICPGIYTALIIFAGILSLFLLCITINIYLILEIIFLFSTLILILFQNIKIPFKSV
ncbi:hypothetical protein DFR58_10963 [Anaerobacterium chartisolvens]|uniref:Uncharacterized protein n=1 Tax=Anaerobacterium chartisolvens TaxID=1297424 RepID=A0A369B8G1_9FIRM|nr:hypothetical protein DFR58_10963 [Anaerobacterium chartisolvens]